MRSLAVVFLESKSRKMGGVPKILFWTHGESLPCFSSRAAKPETVLKVLVKTDKAGRKSVEYLIHFQGWNSSWDRYVSEDYVLKHTDENWRLQRKLAEKAHLRPGAYLYRRDRKDQKLNKVPQKTDSYTEENDRHLSTSASTSRDGRNSCYSTQNIETVSNGDQKKRITADTCESGKKSVMEDKHTLHAHSEECGTHTEYSEHTEERHNDTDNGVTDGVDGGERSENDGSNDQQVKDFAADNNIDDNEADNDVKVNKPEITEDIDQSEEDDDDAAEYVEESNFTCEITDVMKEMLELDNELIKSRNKVVRLPARPNVVTILESYVREFAVNQICGPPEKPRRKYRRHQKNKKGALDMDRLNKSVNICKEVADGVRIYFDFMLSGLLLYNEEKEQYEKSRNVTVTKEPKSRLNTSENKKEANRSFQQPDGSVPSEQSTFQEDAVKFDGKSGTHSVKTFSSSEYTKNLEENGCTSTYTSAGGSTEETEKPNPMGTRSADEEACLPSVSCKEEASAAFRDSVSSMTSLSSKHLSGSIVSNVPPAEGMNRRDCHSTLKLLLPHLLEWQLVPDSLYTEKPVMPSLLYGAVHLARLLVILPSRLLKTDIPAKKHKMVLRHLEMILRYLEQNKDWFAENVYQDNSSLLKQED